MTATSAKPLFQAISAKNKRPVPTTPLFGDLPKTQAPKEERDPLDFDPTPFDATWAFLAAEGDRLRELGGPIWENAVGAGHIAHVLQLAQFKVYGSDIVDRGWPGTMVRPFYSYDGTHANMGLPPSRRIVTNPPYNEINARDGHGRWLKHIKRLFELGLLDYCAMLLNWDWIAARMHGMDELHETFPVSRAYVCCWKIDFRDGGSPPQRNGWLVWDADWQGETVLRRLYKEGGQDQQEAMEL